MQRLNNFQTVIFWTFMHLVFACMCHCTPSLPVRIFCREHVPRPLEEALKLWATNSMHIPIYSLTYWEFCNNLCILSFKKTSIQSCSNWLCILNIWRGKYWFLTHLRCSFVCFPERVQIPDEDFLDVFVCNVHSTDNICVNLSGGEYTVSVFLSYCF